MTTTHKLHYACVDGSKPEDRTRNWLCLTLVDRNKGVTTLAIDENALENIMHQCKDNAHRDSVLEDIFTQINQRATSGLFSGSITVTV